ncbi:MAG: hypothetical protein GY804_00215 [Alphaproteobacteria bacterium]|nr:hypothetical protein [Alphaproteobacteria bacterium]
MATSHDNFFVTTIIDRVTGKSTRVNDLVSSSDLSVKAWVTFTSAAVITDGFNVSSITDSGTGIFLCNFTDPITTGYSVHYTNNVTTSQQTSYGSYEVTTSQCEVRSYVGGSLQNAPINYILVVGN